MERSHPRDVWLQGEPSSTAAVWTAERDGVRVTTAWGAVVERSPIVQTDHILTRLTVAGEQGPDSQRTVEAWGVQRQEREPWGPRCAHA